MPDDETEEQFDRRIREAKEAHDLSLAGADVHISQVQTFASDAMKAPALVALGGVIALLGFYSANFERLSANPIAMAAFGKMLFWLFTSLVATVAAPGMAYLSQIAYTSAIYKKKLIWERPYVRDTFHARSFKFFGDICRWSTILLVMFSIACLIRSGFLFFQIVT